MVQDWLVRCTSLVGFWIVVLNTDRKVSTKETIWVKGYDNSAGIRLLNLQEALTFANLHSLYTTIQIPYKQSNVKLPWFLWCSALFVGVWGSFRRGFPGCLSVFKLCLSLFTGGGPMQRKHIYKALSIPIFPSDFAHFTSKLWASFDCVSDVNHIPCRPSTSVVASM